MTGKVEIGEKLAAIGVVRVITEATVIRADGTIEPLGVIADSANNPKPSFLKRIAALLWRKR